ncbi:MAG: 4Fe-4S binding protein [candidate division Zixibacteria bacterium]|nr:4Fe-4S binding protein [Candidatus Tariuqbacter arcticus]
MATSQSAGTLASALGLSQNICSTFVKGFSGEELEILYEAADGGLAIDSRSPPYIERLLARKFIIPQQDRLHLNNRKDFFCNYILFHRDTIDEEALVHFAAYFPTELSVHNVITYEQVKRFHLKAPAFWFIDCVCRTLFQKCEHPVNVCMGMREEYSLEGARKLSSEEALKIIDDAEERNLVPTKIAGEDGSVWYCFCCGCCCEPINKFIKTGEGIGRGDFIQDTDLELCTGCGDCEDACQFGARRVLDDEIIVDDVLCMGCGVCLDDCSTEAISIVPREDAA